MRLIAAVIKVAHTIQPISPEYREEFVNIADHTADLLVEGFLILHKVLDENLMNRNVIHNEITFHNDIFLLLLRIQLEPNAQHTLDVVKHFRVVH